MEIVPMEAITALAWSLTALDVVLTAGRFYLHWRKLGKIRADDNLNGLALLFLLAFMITSQMYMPAEYQEESYKAGLRTTPPSPTQYNPTKALKLDSANLLMYWCTVYAVKASFLALYWQIFKVSKRFCIAWSMLATYIALSFAISFGAVFWHCGSPATFIDIAACHKWRSRAEIIMYISAVLHIIGDLLLIALPIAMLPSLHLKSREKVAIALVFALVLVEVAFTILRVVFTVAFNGKPMQDGNLIWVTLDPLVAVLVCTLPCYRGLLSSDRARPMISTPDVSFDSQRFNSLLRSLPTRGEHNTSLIVQINEESTDRPPVHCAPGTTTTQYSKSTEDSDAQSGFAV